MNDSALRFQKGLDFLLQHADKELPVVEIDSQGGHYTEQFLGHGFQVQAIEPFGAQAPNPFIQDRREHPVEEIIIPYRSIGVIWAPRATSFVSRERGQRWLELFYDWLAKQGLVFATFLEGEGFRTVTEQGVSGTSKRVETYYKPEEISAMMTFCDFEVIDAWREGNAERMWVHVLGRKTGKN